MTTEEFHSTVDSYKKEIERLDDSAAQQAVEYTSQRLKNLHFSPTLIFSAENFLHFRKTELLTAIERIVQKDEQELIADGFNPENDFLQLKLEHIGLLVYHYKLLVRLRQDDPEAWDEIDELYGDD